MVELVFGVKCMSWPEAMNMSLVDLNFCYERAFEWFDESKSRADKAKARKRR